MSTRLKLSIVVAVVVVALLGLASVAMAEDTETAHGGYDATTNKCLNCHDIHTDADGEDSDYVLLRWATVVDTCGSCHNLYNGADSPPYSSPPGGPYGTYTYTAGQFSGTPGTASDRRAYKVDIADQGTHPGHRMLLGDDIIPGGSGTLNALDIWNLGVPGPSNYSTWSPYDPEAPNTVASSAGNSTAGLYCASCHSPHADFGQQLDVAAGFNPDGGIGHENKLLSSRPNHDTDVVNVTEWSTDGYNYCLACHDQRAPDHTEGWYNHPVEFCLVCHADSRDGSNDGGDYDFPHSSVNPMLLAEEPDGICVTCHPSGSLP